MSDRIQNREMFESDTFKPFGDAAGALSDGKCACGMVGKMIVVVKVGTSTLAHPTGRLNIRLVEELVKVLSDIRNAGHELILVSSGAIGMGAGKMMLKEKPKDIITKQAAAAVGQCELMYTYDKLFDEYRYMAGQILLTASDIEDEVRRKNFQNTIFKLLECNVIPIVNENDTVSTFEISSIGDNDTLAAIVAVNCSADLLILLSDIDGLYTGDPHRDRDAKLISSVYEITPEIEALAGGVGSSLGTGGMATKINAAKMSTEAGIDMVIANGAKPRMLYEIMNGNSVGTRFFAGKNRVQA